MRRALVSVSDKSGLVEFLQPLCQKGLQVVSTGGTLNFLIKNNIQAIDVSAVTDFPEVLDGRVKTLHPRIHMGLLADQRNPSHTEQLKKHQIESFDLVVGNLYPFEKTALQEESTESELIENIDIGGPSFLRAAAKNFHSVTVVSDPMDYSWVQHKILSESLSLEDRKKLAIKVYSLTSYYDALIVQRLSEDATDLPYLNIPLKKKTRLRYGENSHQKAIWFENPLVIPSLSTMKIHQGKELSYNNLLDLDAAWSLAQTMNQPTCVAVKHNNPCGAASSTDATLACQKAIESDPKSIFGGIVAVNTPFNLDMAQKFKDIFLECIIAPEFSAESLDFFSHKKNLRVLTAVPSHAQHTRSSVKSIDGGVLLQEADQYQSSNWTFLRKEPSAEILSSLQFAEKIAGFLKSNSIAIVYRHQTIGLGMGQVNRVDSVLHAINRMKEFISRNVVDMSEVILASDAFFPFPDSIDLIAQAGIQWVLQPGGSNKDGAVFEAAAAHQINLVLSHVRHFRH